MSSTNKGIAVVTGAAGGMGSHIARRLHRDGHRVLLTDIALDPAQRIAEELSPDGSTARAAVLDVAHRQGFVDALAHVQSVWGTPTIVVNNAALTQAADLMTLDEPDFTRVLNTNVNSIFFGCQVFGAAMAEEGYGRIVTIASVAGKEGNPNAAPYSASKAAVIALTKSLGKELAGQDIAVNTITPAAARTRIFDQMSQEHIDFMLSKIPRGRFLEVDEAASMIAWMATRENSFTTGATFDLSGGRATY